MNQTPPPNAYEKSILLIDVIIRCRSAYTPGFRENKCSVVILLHIIGPAVQHAGISVSPSRSIAALMVALKAI